jgi:portal protein
VADDTRSTEAILDEARERFKLAAEAESTNRGLMLEDKQFHAGDQWDEAAKRARKGGQSGDGEPPQPARPCLTIDRLSQPIRQITNQQKSANFGVTVTPQDGTSDKEVAEIYQGIIRRIQNESKDDAPVDWAFESAVIAGLGWWRLLTHYCYHDPSYEGPELFDQEIKRERIPNAMTVYVDPGAKKPTKSDARYIFISEMFPKAEFKRQWPKNAKGDDVSFLSLEEFTSTGDTAWVTTEDVRVVEYWCVKTETTKLAMLENGTIVKSSDVPKGETPKAEREVEQNRVHWYKLCATDVLEEGEWAGEKLPFIPVIGEELNVDGATTYRGLVRTAMDSQRMVNFAFSGVAEQIALTPKAPWIVDPEQIEGHERWWANANTINFAWLPSKTYDEQGRQFTPPSRQAVEQPIGDMVSFLQIAQEGVKATTGIYDPGLGNTNPREKSGRAIIALQQQGDLGNSNYIESLKRSLVYEGELLLDLIPKVYRPGQVVEILGMDDESKRVILGAPFVPGEQGKAPQAVPESEAAQMQQGLTKFYDLKSGKFSVAVTVGKSFTTRRQEGVAAISELLQAAPQLAPVISDLWVGEMDIPGAQKIKERLEKTLPPNLQGDNQEEQTAAQLQAQLQQAAQMIDALSKELNAKTQIIETDAVKAQAQERIASTKVQGDVLTKQAEIEAENARVLAEAASKERIEMRKLEVQLEIEMAKLQSGQAMARAEIEMQDLHHHDEMQQRDEDRLSSEAQANLDRQAAQEQAQMNASQQENANA